MLRSSLRRSSSWGSHDPDLGGLEVVESRPQVLGEAHVPKDEPGLGGEVRDERLIRGGERLVGRLSHRQRAEELALVGHRVRGVRTRDVGKGPVRDRNPLPFLGGVGPSGGDPELGAGLQPDLGTLGGDALSEHPAHPRQHVLVVVGLTHAPENSVSTSYGVARLP